MRRRSNLIHVGNVAVGGGSPVSVQSMTNTDPHDAAATLIQIRRLAAAGCEIIRCTVPDERAAAVLPEITRESPLPVIADIHYDHRLALGAIRAGAAAVRLNPGNLSNPDYVRLVAEAAGEAGIPIRVGANAGSMRPELVQKYLAQGWSKEDAVAEALNESARKECALLEQYGFHAIKVALKCSSVAVTVAACRKFAAQTEYPLHIGVTEAGTPKRGIIKSAVGIGSLLLDGIGDTLRVSLTADPVEEVRAALRILAACGLREAQPEMVSCPSCGRTKINLFALAGRVETLIDELRESGTPTTLRKIAVMGCAVNGPGEARDADLGMAGSGAGKVVLFAKGKTLGAYSEEEAFRRFRELLTIPPQQQ